MKLLAALLLIFLLTGCSDPAAPLPTEETQPAAEAFAEDTTPPATEETDPLEVLLQSMSLPERVGQLFLARCSPETALEDIANYHLGGFVLFGSDFEEKSPEAVTETIASYQAASAIPLLMAVDEEGGTVTRISRYSQFRSSPFPSPRQLYGSGGLEALLETEEEKCALLRSLGINVNLGPVCDISTQPGALLYPRSLGQSPEITSGCISAMVEVMADNAIGSVLKHFPGYGDNADTHVQMATDSRSLEELESRDLLPFRAGIEAGADAVMVSHIIVEALDPQLPASLSPAVHRYLREDMGFDGVIVTDDLAMEAIAQRYGAGEAAVLAVLAGNDLLCSTDYALQYEAVLEAVLTGRIDYYTLTDAVRRILRWKQELGLL